VPIRLKRAPLRRNGPEGLDITVKSAKDTARVFAPPWVMVRNYKSGALSEVGYRQWYETLLDRVSDADWAWLSAQAKNGEVTLLCYCPDGKFCHTHLLIDYACRKFPKRFMDGRERPAEGAP
jgi:uncharacterized protein YeaO (DUF488 family)